jgi:isocitrate/isopropylmalate dehydrogenase
MAHTITLIPGDGIGPEERTLRALGERTRCEAGGRA